MSHGSSTSETSAVIQSQRLAVSITAAAENTRDDQSSSLLPVHRCPKDDTTSSPNKRILDSVSADETSIANAEPEAKLATTTPPLKPAPTDKKPSKKSLFAALSAFKEQNTLNHVSTRITKKDGRYALYSHQTPSPVITPITQCDNRRQH